MQSSPPTSRSQTTPSGNSRSNWRRIRWPRPKQKVTSGCYCLPRPTPCKSTAARAAPPDRTRLRPFGATGWSSPARARSRRPASDPHSNRSSSSAHRGRCSRVGLDTTSAPEPARRSQRSSRVGMGADRRRRRDGGRRDLARARLRRRPREARSENRRSSTRTSRLRRTRCIGFARRLPSRGA